MKTQQHTYRPGMHTAFKVNTRCTSLWPSFLLGIELTSSSRIFGLTPYHALHTPFYISSFKHSCWLPTPFFIIFQTFSVELISGKFPGYMRTGISLHSRNVLVLLDLWNGTKASLRYIPSVGTQRICISLYFTNITIDAMVVFGANRMWNIMLSVFRLL